MKTKYIIGMLLLGITIWWGCSDEETLTPSDIPEYKLQLPRGDNEYDQYIREFYDRTGVYILYHFEPSDVYFNLNDKWAEVYSDTTVTRKWYVIGKEAIYDELWESYYVPNEGEYYLGESSIPGGWMSVSEADGKLLVEKYLVNYEGDIKVKEAKEEYVDKQLQLLQECFLHFYPDSLLSSYLPLKILLGRELQKYVSTTDLVGLKPIAYYTIFNNLVVSYSDETIDELDAETKRTIKEELNLWFIDKLKAALSFDEFFALTDYSWAGKEYNPDFNDLAYCYSLGLVDIPGYNAVSTLEACKNDDLSAYMKLIIQHSYTALTAEPVISCPLEEWCEGEDCLFADMHEEVKGVLLENELIRKKYDALIRIFQRAGVDLQAIGNLYND